VVKQKVTALLTEASNFAGSLNKANADIYKQIDPLMKDPNNPLRLQMQNQQFVEQSLSKQGINYQNLMAEMAPQAPAGTQPALDAKTGKPGFATPDEIQNGTAIAL
jgi:hypothetical protein